MPSRSERTTWVRYRDSYVPPVTGICGQIDGGTTSTDVSTIKMALESPVET